jgi:hypothetical protein
MTHVSIKGIVAATAVGALLGGCATSLDVGPGYYSYDSRVSGTPRVTQQAPTVVYREPTVVYREPAVVYREPAVVYVDPNNVYRQPTVVYGATTVYTQPSLIPRPAAAFSDKRQ